MNALSLRRININAPYKVWSDGNRLRFESDNGIMYLADFELDSNPFFNAYWFNLANPLHRKSPGDVKIAQTVICIIEEFFRQNPDVLLYSRPSAQGCSCAGLMATSNRRNMPSRRTT